MGRARVYASEAERQTGIAQEWAERVHAGTGLVIAGTNADVEQLNGLIADRLRTVLAGAADGVLTTAQDALVVLDVRSAKGLEIDAVVLVEPDELAPSDLYVAMTRPTQRLVLVHSRDLPKGAVPQA